MIRFCKNCGSSLDSSGSCPKCSGKTAKGKPPEKSDDKEKVKLIPRKDGKMNRFYLWSLVGLITCCVITTTLSVLVFFNVLDIPFINDVFISMNMKDELVEEQPIELEEKADEAEETDEEEIVEQPDNNDDLPNEPDSDTSTRVDSDEYYNNNTTVISQFSAMDSLDVHSESDAYDNFISRGFEQYPITTNYSISGEYTDEQEISKYSSTKHPMYQTWYMTPSGTLWQIVEINGTIMASGFSEDMSNVTTVSETDTITSYDSQKNKFYVNTPNESEMKITKVNNIDATTLDGININ